MNNNRKFIKTKYEGVYYRLSQKNDDSTGKPDRIYCFCYTDKAGKIHWKTVGRHSEGYRVKSAKLARATFLTELGAGARKSGTSDNDAGYTIDDAVNAYLAWGDNPGKDFGSSFRVYNNHLKPMLGDKPISRINKQFVLSVVSHLKNATRIFGSGTKANRPLAPATIVGALSFVRAAISRAIANQAWIGENPFDPSDGTWSFKPMHQQRRIRFFTREEARLLLDELLKVDKQIHDMALLSLRTGLRATEIFKLRGIDVDTNGNILHIIGKGKKRMAIQIPQDMIAMLAGYNRDPAEPIFQRPKLKTPFTTIPKPFLNAVERLNLQASDIHSLYHVTFHTLRHTFASWLAQSGKVTLLELQKLMRHQKIEMTMRYAHLMPGQESEKLSVIDDFLD